MVVSSSHSVPAKVGSLIYILHGVAPPSIASDEKFKKLFEYNRNARESCIFLDISSLLLVSDQSDSLSQRNQKKWRVCYSRQP